MSRLKVEKTENIAERGPQGLENGGHIYPQCSNCEAVLMDIWVTKPNLLDPSTKKPFEWDIKANCPFCGDSSFICQVHGGFHYGGYGKIKKDDANDDVPSTIVEDCVIEGNAYAFKIKKATPDSLPIKRIY